MQFCFFAHSPEELREPELANLGKPEETAQDATPQTAIMNTGSEDEVCCIPFCCIHFHGCCSGCMVQFVSTLLKCKSAMSLDSAQHMRIRLLPVACASTRSCVLHILSKSVPANYRSRERFFDFGVLGMPLFEQRGDNKLCRLLRQ